MAVPLVSIVVPTFNRVAWLPGAIEFQFLRRAVRHGAVGQIARVAVALGRS